MKSKIKDAVRASKSLRKTASLAESAVWGGTLREKALLWLLENHYKSSFRRQWKYGLESPHFMDQRIGSFLFSFSNLAKGPYAFYRGFFSSEILRDGDLLLDIGCGDGYFTKRFFSEICHSIDAIDIERQAIKRAVDTNSAPNIRYSIRDAVNQPFPSAKYDVIVWDGALGHFSADTTSAMLSKIALSLSDGGIFVGSECLGTEEGEDHLQFFHTLNDFRVLFKPFFKIIQVREVSYPIGIEKNKLRREAYWRCAQDNLRMEDASWKNL